jgi:hypothetical protein
MHTNINASIGIPAFELAKTVHALDRWATVIGKYGFRRGYYGIVEGNASVFARRD